MKSVDSAARLGEVLPAMLLVDTTSPATLDGVSTLRRVVRRSLSELRLPHDAVDDLQLAVSELGSNIVRHGRPIATRLRLLVRIERHLFRVEIEDDGGSFAGFQERLAGAQSSRDAARDGGMGLDFVRSSVDGIQYRQGTPNRLVFTRRIHRRRPAVLLIEDDPVLRDLYREMLAAPFEPAVAGSIAEARAAIAQSTPDAIVSDFHLGDGKGSEVSSLLGEPGRQLPVPLLILTADRRPTLQSLLLREGVDAILPKPVSARDLVAAVRGALARSARQQASVLAGLGEFPSRFTMSLEGSELAGWRIGHAHSPAGRGGGDIAFVLSRAGGSRLVMADVVGHGLKARASAIGISGAVRALAAQPQAATAAGLMTSLNAAMLSDPALGGIFATVQAIDLAPDGRMTLANAGHPEPWIIDRTGELRRVTAEGPMPGLLGNAAYADVEIALASGQRLLLMTDGVDPSDMSGGGDVPEWLVRAAAQTAGLAVEDAASRLAQAVAASEPLEQSDDWTIVVLERDGSQPAER